VDTPPNGIHNGVVVDIGNDGDYDIYGAGWSGYPPVWLWENQLNPLKRGDLNRDGFVNVSDFGILLSNWGSTSPHPADLNQDGKIDGMDLDIMLKNWYSP
jgi:hypothetical protein